MTLHVPEPSPMHRAALTLHALSRDDRTWVLDALTVDERSMLQPLLVELEELGIPSHADLLDEVTRAGGQKAVCASDVLQALDEADVRRLATVLAAEPPGVAAALLSGGDWPWRERLLAGLPAAMAEEMRWLARSAPSAAALQAAVIAETARHIESDAGGKEPASRWQVLRRGLAAMGNTR